MVVLAIAFFTISALYKLLCTSFGVIINCINTIIRWLGRGYLNSKVGIPLEFASALEKSNFLKDDEKTALEGYNPVTNITHGTKKITYKPILNSITEQKTTNIVNCESIKELVIVDNVNYINELNKLDEVDYPVLPPTKPQSVIRPPNWTQWLLSVEMPTFKPPYYKGLLSIFNFAVDHAYHAEIERLNYLKSSFEEIKNKYNIRNNKVKDLWEKACVKYEYAIIRQDLDWNSLLEQYNTGKKDFFDAYNAEKKGSSLFSVGG